MDKGKNSVLTYLNMLSHNHALTTAQLADSLNLSRSVVSHYLNELFREEKIQKISGRPVKWTKKGSNPNYRSFGGRKKLSSKQNCTIS